MALEGTLSDFGLADIFQLIGIQHKTGVLTLSNAEATVKVYFRDGMLVNADSMRKGNEDRLGILLVKTGRITEEQLQDALKSQRETLQQLGHILVSRKYLTTEELSSSLRMQVTQVVYRLFRWKEGEYHFDQDVETITGEGHFEPIPSEGILMEGVRMLDEWPIIESRITSHDLVFKKSHPKAAVEVVEDADSIDRDDDTALQNLIGGKPRDSPGLGRQVKLTASEDKVYAKIDGRRTVRDLVDCVSLSEFDVCKAVYEMAERNVIAEWTAPAAERAEPSPRREIPPSVVKVLYAVVVAWLAVSLATMRYNPLDYWAWPPTSNMKVDSFRGVRLRLALEKVSLALEAHRVVHGSYPKDLEALVSEGFIAEPEVRGPDGAPISYELRGTGFTLAYK